MSISVLVPNPTIIELGQIDIGFAKHPDRERELEVWIRNSAILVEHTLDRLLRPRTILLQSQQISVLFIIQEYQHTGSCRSMTNLTAFRTGSGSGYRAYMSDIAAQHVCTI